MKLMFRLLAFAFIAILILPSCEPRVQNSDKNKVAVVADFALTVDTENIIATVDERYLSVAVDSSQVVGGNWWSASGEVEVGVGETQVDPFDFSNEKLRNLARNLAPAFLRIGGSEADKLYYDLSDEPVEEAPEDYDFVLNKKLWDQVNDFAGEVGFDVMFTINAGPGPRDEDKAWHSDNARELIEYTVAKNYSVPVWELGNEINGYLLIHGLDWIITGEKYAEDMAVFKQAVNEIDPQGKIAGPASAFWPLAGEFPSILPQFMENAPEIDIVTWHYYPQQSRRCPIATRRAGPEVMLSPYHLNQAEEFADYVNGLRDTYLPEADVWLGETGNAQCGGEPGLSDRYIASLWWLDQLGSMAQAGQKVTVRQTLAGSEYGMLTDTTFVPNPDYWVSVLWKRLMGAAVLSADVAPAENPSTVRAYAHCTKDGQSAVSLVLINLDKELEAEVTLGGLAGRDAGMYLLTGNDPYSRDILLNGELLFSDSDGNLPEMDTAPFVGADSVTLPPVSMLFLVFEDAAAVCSN